jgi:hypothetical protein
MSEAVDERYEAKVDRSGGPDACHPWGGAPNGEGFGMFRADGNTRAAHRWAYIRYVHPLSREESIRFTCGNRLCQNRRHWAAESRPDNARRTRTGGGSGRARLTEAAVVAIRASREPNARLADRYKVSARTVSQVRAWKTWRQVQSAP